MTVATISSKGQITLPAEALRAIGVAAGDRVTVSVVDGAIVIERAVDFLSLRGALGPALPLTGLDEEDATEAIVQRR